MNDARARIRAFLTRIYPMEEIGDDDDFFARGLNSLYVLQLLKFVEEEFQIRLADSDLEMANFCSVAAIGRLIERKGHP